MTSPESVGRLHPTVILWMAVGWFGFALLPWYGVDENFFTLSWLFDGWPLGSDVAPALFLVLKGEKLWLAPIGFLLAAPLLLWGRRKSDPLFGTLLIAIGALGFAWFLAQGWLASGATLYVDSGQHLLSQPRDVLYLAREGAVP